jgi:gamma-glutamyltranspeptidase/glutathione hydrolase
MSPTIVLDGKRPELVVGGSGGPFIVSGVVQTILGVVALDRSLPEAVGAPRIHDQGSPAGLLVEQGIDGPTRKGLERIGHHVTEMAPIGAVAAVGLAADGTPLAAGDRRKDGGEAVVGSEPSKGRR